MWPWEHLAFGYVCYSGYCHLRSRRPPRSAAALALAVATQLPDLVDKPLAWSLSVLPSGHSLAHSLFTALPLSLLAYLLSRRAGRPDVGAAFAIGYCSHLAGDVIYPIVVGKEPFLGFLLWPVVPAPANETGLGLLARISTYFGQYVTHLSDPSVMGFLALEIGMLLVAAALWVVDGLPGLPRGLARYARVAEQ